MTRFVKKKKQEIGLSPYDLLFRGKQKTDNVLLRVIDFDSDNLEEDTVETVKEVLNYQKKSTVTWFNVDGLHNKAIMEEIAKGFQFEQLVLAEVMNSYARSRVQEHSNCILISIKMLQLDEQTHLISAENLSVILTDSLLISFQEKEGDVFEPVRERIRVQKKRIRSSGTDYLAFALLDIVVDNYIYIIGDLGEQIESLEETLLEEPRKDVIDEIYTYKRELNLIRKNIKPAKEMILTLSKIE